MLVLNGLCTKKSRECENGAFCPAGGEDYFIFYSFGYQGVMYLKVS
jgi:hypothetical protein